MGRVEIINLVDNTATKHGLLAEHGLSFLIRVNGEVILFDTGAGNTVVHNAREMGIDLSQIKKVVLSHGHYDHAGGLKKVCEVVNKSLPIYCHPETFSLKYRVDKNKKPIYIGTPWTKEEIEKIGGIFNLNCGPVELTDGVKLTGQIPRDCDFEDLNEVLCVKSGSGYVVDRLLDDQSLIIDTPKGPIVVLGCSHSGLINTLQYVLSLGKYNHIYAVIGGTHLKDASLSRLEKTMTLLPKFGIEHIIACHCTGFLASAKLYQTLGDKFCFNYVGRSFCI
ncbi:MAG: 7,8-dihydropterin-6-yl-methyl-4-(beta-D-ribofuranosyl)aminobenzene 5-phosphate synthase [Clostridia bacterium]|nr:7,8-dihydropterin-6-yl-methyl-4-(beta-D-ribofuranosyl)aminobenzene 5-phosphate synthase [Clostridia bacterium]